MKPTPNQLCLLTCRNFQQEVAAAIAAEGWPDVVSVAYPARCGRPPLDWEELRPLLPEECTQVIIMGRSCLSGMDQPPDGFPKLRVMVQEQCFHLVAGAGLVTEALARGAYLISPAWLKNWRDRLSEMGFSSEQTGEFFREFASELVLFDTGIDPAAPTRLSELGQFLGLPVSRLAVGLDHIRLFLSRMIGDWRLEEERRLARARSQEQTGELADHLAAMDFLPRLARSVSEAEAIGIIKDLLRMLFAPEELHYLRVEQGIAASGDDIPETLLTQLQGLKTDHAWTASGSGFLLRISREDEVLGLIAVERLAFPAFRERYLNLALAVTGVCGLAIENARTHKKLVESEKMASLGYLVAGVAHEINTPVGVGLTASSALEDQTMRLLARFTGHSMTHSDLKNYLDASCAEVGLIRTSLDRIGRMVDAFRQVAVAGERAEKCRFRMKQCLDDVVASFGEAMAAQGIELNICCAEGLEVESFPGDWASIFINLIANSLKHGFNGHKRGRIDLGININAGSLLVDYRDDGAGMDGNTLKRAFDPFFTTDLQHGMGLGLHLVYNLVTQRLGGSIVCDSKPGKGVHFHLEIPYE